MLTRLLHLAALALFAILSSCVGLGTDQLPVGLGQVLEKVDGFSVRVNTWRQGLGPQLDEASLSKLVSWVGQANDLESALGEFGADTTGPMRAPLDAIGEKLNSLGSLDLPELRQLRSSQEQMQIVAVFAASATQAGELSRDFLKRFGG